MIRCLTLYVIESGQAWPHHGRDVPSYPNSAVPAVRSSLIPSVFHSGVLAVRPTAHVAYLPPQRMGDYTSLRLSTGGLKTCADQAQYRENRARITDIAADAATVDRLWGLGNPACRQLAAPGAWATLLGLLRAST